jgi:hypothetical protein
VALDTVEPQVEVIGAKHTTDPDKGTLYGRNPRLLSLPVSPLRGYFELDVRDRAFVHKTQLCTISPYAAGHLADPDVRLMARWLGKRYTRDAFPDAFNRRLAVAQKKLANLGKSAEGKSVTTILISIDQVNTELPDNEDYRIILWFVFRPLSLTDDSRRAQAEKFASRFVAAICSCDGITVSDEAVKTPQEVTLEDLETMKRLDYDFRSPEE